MSDPTLHRAFSALKIHVFAWGFFTFVIANFYSSESDMVTELTSDFGSVSANVFFVLANTVFRFIPAPVDWIPFYDTFACVCQVVATYYSKIQRIMQFLEMCTYAIIIGIPVLPMIVSIVAPTLVETMKQRYENIIDVFLDQSAVLLTAGCILMMISTIVCIVTWGTNQERIILTTTPRHLEPHHQALWFVFKCLVVVGTTLKQKQVESFCGNDSFFAFQVGVLVANHLFCYGETVCMDLRTGTGNYLHSIKGCLWQTGSQKMRSPSGMKQDWRNLQDFIQSEDLGAWNTLVGNINTQKGNPETVAKHMRIKLPKNVLQANFGSQSQGPGPKQYVFALKCMPDKVVFTIFFVGMAYVAATDVANLRKGVPLLTYTAWKFLAEMWAHARGNGTPPAVVLPDVFAAHPKNLTCPITVHVQNDAGDRKNAAVPPPKGNAAQDTPKDKVSDGSMNGASDGKITTEELPKANASTDKADDKVSDRSMNVLVRAAEGTAYAAVGTAFAGLGYAVYGLLTQG